MSSGIFLTLKTLAPSLHNTTHRTIYSLQSCFHLIFRPSWGLQDQDISIFEQPPYLSLRTQVAVGNTSVYVGPNRETQLEVWVHFWLCFSNFELINLFSSLLLSLSSFFDYASSNIISRSHLVLLGRSVYQKH